MCVPRVRWSVAIATAQLARWLARSPAAGARALLVRRLAVLLVLAVLRGLAVLLRRLAVLLRRRLLATARALRRRAALHGHDVARRAARAARRAGA
eukprot:CAMPEP_0198316158 /NCGR_PEP_ID=MMETSP1450-20131203/6154_1 /TAXON_ID=753684 ORGANISM="Madagascaria erythrocladiodes, Strain CCMP3234" /NCGR_SAMPLE_ID=MMETSP1450 /ASSEMBLY_ACC=CAM_ASM_001115 /LENGTH=95 /DNA_ID=CAMNT_0044019301 /DNA_START=87 /DNA_END=370 /DNA_ORIENTATION=-